MSSTNRLHGNRTGLPSKSRWAGFRALYLLVLFSCASPLHAGPQQDLAQLRDYYRQRFPHIPFSDYANGVYAIDPVARASWRAIEEFPPYEEAVEQGKLKFDIPFADGARYADCFSKRGTGISQHYPRWDANAGEVVTLAGALNACRQRHHEKPLDPEKGEIAQLLAYMAFTSRGKAIAIDIPANDPRALAAYQEGKAFYYGRRGRLNFACATCHVQNVGRHLRAETLSATLGQVANWPAQRLKWGEMGTLHRRFRECLTQIKADAPPAQSRVLRNLEYFLTYMSNGLPVTGPSTRK